jgi:protein TonB
MNFQRVLLQHIEHYQNYPGLARRLRLQGTVLVLFSMRRDGAVLDVWIKTGSGAPILDQEAIDTIRRAQPLPPIPAELPSLLKVIVPVAFNLS